MRHLNLINKFRELISQLRHEAQTASAMQLYDAHKIAEQVICGLLRELYGYSGMRNLNAEQSNFPGIDLADDTARIAVQVTATADLAKIKHTLETFAKHKLHERYDRLIIYILTARQSSYSQSAIDSASGGFFPFSASDDIFDYQNISAQAASASPKNLQAAINVLTEYLRGIPVGLADEDIDPPLLPSEEIFSNLIEIYFPPQLYVAQINADIMERSKQIKSSYLRNAVRSFSQEAGLPVPSAYVAHGGSLITFFDLDAPDNPYRYLIESGTSEAIPSKDYWKIDQDHEKVFKSLLRFSLQQRLYVEYVSWYNDEKQFVFLPRPKDGNTRDESWQGDRQSRRMVFLRQFNKKDRAKVLMQKHLAFSVEFHNLSENWLMSITPTWFFSHGDSFKKSGYGHDNLSWVKRRENNRAVLNHFRFISAWLKSIDEEDLFSQAEHKTSFLSFGDNVTFNGAPSLDESQWASLPEPLDDDGLQPIQRSFG